MKTGKDVPLAVALLAVAWHVDAQELHLNILERGPHHRVVSFTRLVTNEVGQVRLHQGTYTELQGGLHYFANGQWVESEEVVEPAPFGAVAPRLPYRVSFAANLNTAGAIDLVLPDGHNDSAATCLPSS